MVGGPGPEFQHCPPEGGARDGGKEKEWGGWQDGVNGDAVEIKRDAKGPEEEGVSVFINCQGVCSVLFSLELSHYPLTSPSLSCLPAPGLSSWQSLVSVSPRGRGSVWVPDSSC